MLTPQDTALPLSETAGIPPEGLAYFRPTKRFHRYLVFRAVSEAEGGHVTQRAIAEQVGLSAAVVNRYLAEAEEEGSVRRAQLNGRDYSYHLTSEGRSLYRELAVGHIRETFRLFRSGRDELAGILEQHRSAHGVERVLFYTAGQVTEVLLQAVPRTSLELVAVVDDDPAKQGRSFFGWPVISREEIEEQKVDGVIVTTFRYREEIFDKLRHLRDENIEVIGF